ncbi:MAG TPA: NAD(P)/FAD-dependent oxidoreductase [Candidatus Dormibacteraeota bacterium]|nr:NAD(P)/FAD-dependent oxidoreductase [Candidatus Dormibacteraeota bacterium]
MADAATRVVIIGGGFGGLYATRALRRAPVEVTLIDRRNFHLFQPLLYQVATGGLSPGEIASPLRAVVTRQKNTRVLLGEVEAIDLERRCVRLSDGEVPYDELIVATGATHHYFGHDEWEPLAPGLKTIEDATEIRRRILLAFETAEREPDAAEREAWLTFVVVGAGPTGVELAGALSEIANDTLKNDFRVVHPRDSRILLVEAADRVLPPYPPDLSEKARRSLERLGVTVRLQTSVTAIAPDAVTVATGGRSEVIKSHTVLWAAGVAASPLARQLATATGATVDRNGRIHVQSDLSLPGHPEVVLIGDMVHVEQDGALLPGVAPVAMAQGRYAAQRVATRCAGREPPPFRYRDKGTMATIGRSSAVADLRFVRFSGLLAWLAWLFIHLLYLVEFENRLLVLVQWAFMYFTRNRGARLITGDDPLPLPITRSDEEHEGPRKTPSPSVPISR